MTTSSPDATVKSPAPVVVTVEPPVPVLTFTAVAPVTLPTVTVLALAPVPTFTAPVVPESRETADDVVPTNVSVVLPVTVVASNVRAALAEPTPNVTQSAKARKPKPKPLNIFFIIYNN